MVYQLDNDIWFPKPELANEDGLLAVGGDLSFTRLLLAYENGIFPWFNDDSPILWFSPHERFVLFPDKVKISKSMKQIIKKERFTLTFDTAFERIIKLCADTKRADQAGTWITDDMQKAYLNLHIKGLAHSVEVWEQNELVGGLYGVLINDVFCGESMFSKTANASKIALIWLCKNLNLQLIDCQIYSQHLQSLGAETISRQYFMEILNQDS